jgi:hypothetical protein
MTTRTIRITVQLTIDETKPNSFQPVDNPAHLGEIAKAWWQAQRNVTSCGPGLSCCDAEVVEIEEPKALRYSAGFCRALEKKRERVQAIWGQFWDT